MGRFRVAFKISRKRVQFREITVDTEDANVDPQAEATRQKIREAIGPDYDARPDLVELVTVTAESTDKKLKPWSAGEHGQDKSVATAVSETATETKGPTQTSGFQQPTREQLLAAGRSELEMVVEQFKLQEVVPNYKIMTSDELGPALADHFYPAGAAQPQA